MTAFNFKERTWNNVINPLKSILEKRAAENPYYPTLGHFYREIEILKFPFMKGHPKPRFNPVHGRNVYSQQQYDSIVEYCVENGLVKILPNVMRKNSYIVYVPTNKTAK